MLHVYAGRPRWRRGVYLVEDGRGGGLDELAGPAGAATAGPAVRVGGGQREGLHHNTPGLSRTRELRRNARPGRQAKPAQRAKEQAWGRGLRSSSRERWQGESALAARSDDGRWRSWSRGDGLRAHPGGARCCRAPLGRPAHLLVDLGLHQPDVQHFHQGPALLRLAPPQGFRGREPTSPRLNWGVPAVQQLACNAQAHAAGRSALEADQAVPRHQRGARTVGGSQVGHGQVHLTPHSTAHEDSRCLG
jgi:hypothetical protein